MISAANDGSPSGSPRPLAIAHVDCERGFSGGEVQVFLLMEGLAARGHRQCLVCPPGSGSAQELTRRGLDVDCLEVTARGDWDLLAPRRMARALEGFGPEVVHLHTGRSTWHGSRAAARLGLPSITTRRMDRPVKRNWRTALIYERLVDRAVAIAPAVADRLRDGGVPPAKLRTIWSVVDPARIVADEPRAALRAQFGMTPGEVAVVAAASLVRRKGLDLLLEALAGLDVGWPVRLWIAGEGPERAALVARAERPDLAGRVTFLGRLDAIGDLLSAADVAALPSRAEGLGVAALEAMAAGLPVLASRVGGLGQAVVDGETGLLVAPESVDEIRDALARLAAEPELRAALGAGGRARVREHFLPEHMVVAYERLYREVLEERT